MDDELLALTSDIVTAHVSNNKVAITDLPALIEATYSALAKTSKPAEPDVVHREPAVSVRSSVKPDYIVCLEDGAKLKMLKRYIRTRYDMSPEDYRQKWGLPYDYPMVAPNYAEQRRKLAHKIGLGRKQLDEVMAEPAAVTPRRSKKVSGDTAETPAKRDRGRPRRAAAEVPAEEAVEA